MNRKRGRWPWLVVSRAEQKLAVSSLSLWGWKATWRARWAEGALQEAVITAVPELLVRGTDLYYWNRLEWREFHDSIAKEENMFLGEFFFPFAYF
ncbi:hypothetical protein CDAR_120401 [Caerostris darwini]|uniref:Uncharacterized protein n=1 Tax=Caerostris darwini TaxID=1538125 RepID=A0AAV4RB83_9ARAC|nr:hypothetical protein CDAR_120401 [Caerostris darwini]